MEKKAKERELARLILTVKVHLEEARGKELPEAAIYAFDQTGHFLTSVPLPKGEHGEARIELPSELRGTTVRVLIAPALVEHDEGPSWMVTLMRKSEGKEAAPSPAVLIRRGAYEKRMTMHSERETVDMTVFQHDWAKWLLCRCVVRGRLVKRLTLPDGTVKDFGVCSACVGIYEVDKFPNVILRLPERDLFRLRDDLRVILEQELPKPKVWPPPPPPPPELYGVLGPVRPFSGSFQPEHRVETYAARMKSSQFAPQLRAELEPIFTATSSSQLRTAMLAGAGRLAQFACILEWLHSHLHIDLIKCVPTDERGRFETTIFYPCGGDKPDLYFRASQCIGGVLHTLYNPGVACHTYWDYACGTEVVLEVTDPAAITCVPVDPVDPPPGVSLWVMPYGIGNIHLYGIKPIWQKNSAWHTIAVDPSKHGLTDYVSEDIGALVDAPFGGTLGFRHGYSSDIPIDMPGKPFYYRWRYRKEGESDWHDFASPVAETVVRHYADYDLNKKNEPPTFPVYPLGPHSKNGMHLYEFKPHEEDLQAKAPQDHKYEWPPDEWFADIHSGILKSTSLPDGKYQIMLQIYDKDAKRIAPDPNTFQFIVPIPKADDGSTEDRLKTRLADPAEIQDDGFVFYVHIDNSKCTAIIDTPTIGTVSADGCGFLRYAQGDMVHIAFHALHQANYATFGFQIYLADTSVSTAAAAGEVKGPAGSYTDDGNGNFWHDFAIDELAGACPEAAFSENLSVYAKATNGYDRLRVPYDMHAVRAFALAPKQGGT